MNELQIFNNAEFGTVRTVEMNGEPWLVGKDVAQALGYSNTKDALSRHVDPEDKRGSRITTPSGVQEMTIINESGLYSLVLSSKLPGAKKFKRWVTSEVLPSLRKHGLYAADELLNNPDLVIQAMEALKDERAKNKALETENAQQRQVIGELQPKADYTDRILKSKGVVPITAIAKDYGMSGKEMNKLLHRLGVQYRMGNMWLLYSRHHGKGYTHSETFEFTHSDGIPDVNMTTKWTQKGRLFLYQLLKENGILPMIERPSEAV